MSAEPAVMRSPIATLVILLLAAWPALVPADAVDRGAECVQIEDDGARLACYDRAFSRRDSGALPAPTAAASPPPAAHSPPSTADSQKAASAATSTAEQGTAPAELTAAFGAEDLARAREDAEPESKLDSLEARVIEVQPNRRGKHVYRLDNGQTWQQVESTDLVPVRVEDTVRIWRGAFNSYRLRRTDGGRTVTVRRTN